MIDKKSSMKLIQIHKKPLENLLHIDYKVRLITLSLFDKLLSINITVVYVASV